MIIVVGGRMVVSGFGLGVGIVIGVCGLRVVCVVIGESSGGSVERGRRRMWCCWRRLG